MDYGIMDFLSDVDERIYNRGVDYFESGMIKKLEKNGNQYSAEVSGSGAGLYTVTIELTPTGAVEDFSCDCPFDSEDVCKHIVAVLLAIMKKEYSQPSTAANKSTTRAKKAAAAKGTPEISMEELLKSAPKEDLAALILLYSENDEAFRCEVLAALGAPVSQELEAAKELVKSTVRQNTARGFIDYRGCDTICFAMDTVLDNAKRRTERGQYPAGIELAQYIALEGAKLVAHADDSSGALGCTMETALDIINKSAIALRMNEEMPKEKLETFEGLLKTAKNKAFDGWEDWRYGLLCGAAWLCGSIKKKDADKLSNYLDKLLFAYKADGACSSYCMTYDYETRFCMKKAMEGDAAARAYLNAHLDVDRIRELAVREDMDNGDYDSAERLCIERMKKQESAFYSRPNAWPYLLYDVYTESKQREKQVSQAQALLLSGDMSYYQKLKALLSEDETWEKDYPALLKQIKSSCPYYIYMRILEIEQETALLMEQLRLHPEHVFEFGKSLQKEYTVEICKITEARIRSDVPNASGRGEYKRICSMILELDGFGGTVLALALIEELRKAYLRRPAMQDELDKAERKIIKKRG